MKRYLFLLLFLIALSLILTGCSNSNAIAGEWYSTKYPEDTMVFNQDETFLNESGNAGTYSYENGTIILMYNDGLSETFTESTELDKKCLIDENGTIWFNDYDFTCTYHEEYVADAFEEYKNITIGTWYDGDGINLFQQGLLNNPDEWGRDNPCKLIISNDNTYEIYYVSNGNLIESGEWWYEENGDYLKIKTNATYLGTLRHGIVVSELTESLLNGNTFDYDDYYYGAYLLRGSKVDWYKAQ